MKRIKNMILKDTVKIYWHNRTKKHYESLGYTYTKLGNEFEVRVTDLPVNSHILIDVCCDNINCHNPVIKQIQYRSYINQYNKLGGYYCKACATRLFATEKAYKTKLNNSKSFYKWCIENDRGDLLNRWDYDLNNCDPNEITFSSQKIIYLKCSQNKYESEKYKISNITSNNIKAICKKCNSLGEYLINTYGENALSAYWDYNKNKNDPFDISKSSKTIVWIKCQKKDYHGSYKITCNKIYDKDLNCPLCSNKSGKVHLLDSLGTLYPEILNIWADTNEKSPYEYTPKSNKSVWWKCADRKHKDYYRNINNSNKYNFQCPECVRERNESFLQEKVRKYCNNLGYKVLHEHNCNIVPINPKTNYPLPFDNEVVELKLIIEVHGSQHYYKPTGTHFSKDFDLHKQKLYDRYKRIYAKFRGYYYLEIPFWTNNEKDSWKKLIDKKINEILIKQKNKGEVIEYEIQ